MVDVSFELRGRTVSLDDVEANERLALEAAARKVAHALASVRCAEHGSTPEVLVLGDEVHHLEFRVRGCCAALVNAAMDQLRDESSKEWWEKDRVPSDPWAND